MVLHAEKVSYGEFGEFCEAVLLVSSSVNNLCVRVGYLILIPLAAVVPRCDLYSSLVWRVAPGASYQIPRTFFLPPVLFFCRSVSDVWWRQWLSTTNSQCSAIS